MVVWGANLLSSSSLSTAQLLGSTVVRIRGYIRPFYSEDASGVWGGTVGMIIDQDNADVETTGNNQGSNNSPVQRPHDDWLAWLPWESQAGTNFGPASWNPYASPWAVDIKSSRKIEELGQTLWLFHNSPPTVGLSWNLSIGLKLP